MHFSVPASLFEILFANHLCVMVLLLLSLMCGEALSCASHTWVGKGRKAIVVWRRVVRVRALLVLKMSSLCWLRPFWPDGGSVRGQAKSCCRLHYCLFLLRGNGYMPAYCVPDRFMAIKFESHHCLFAWDISFWIERLWDPWGKCSLPGPQCSPALSPARSCLGASPAEISTCSHMGSWCYHGKDFSRYAVTWGPIFGVFTSLYEKLGPRDSQRKGQLYHPFIVHSPNACTCWVWPMPKPGGKNSIWMGTERKLYK